MVKQHNQHTSRRLLLDQKNDEKLGKEPEHQLNDLFIESSHECVDKTAILNERERQRRQRVPHVLGDQTVAELDEMSREVTEKPSEKNTTPVVPAYCNFRVARKMAQENLEHQPLPDSIMDRAYRKLQAQGYPNPELALNVFPIATGQCAPSMTMIHENIIISVMRRCWCQNIHGRSNSLYKTKSLSTQDMRCRSEAA